MDLCNMPRQRMDVLADEQHDSKAAMPAMRRARIHDYAMTTNAKVIGAAPTNEERSDDL